MGMRQNGCSEERGRIRDDEWSEVSVAAGVWIIEIFEVVKRFTAGLLVFKREGI